MCGGLSPTSMALGDASSSAFLDDSVSALSSSLFFPSRGQHAKEPARLAHLASSFALSDAEVAFFDAVIQRLAPASTSFAELKDAFNACRRDANLATLLVHELRVSYTPEAQASLDARLWNTLLSLVQVRGHTWAERWDSIRVGLGKEPLEADVSYSMSPIRAALPSPPLISDASMESAPAMRFTSSTPIKPRLSAARRALFHRLWDTYRRRIQRRLFRRWVERTHRLARMYARAMHTHEQVALMAAWAHWRHAAQRHLDDHGKADTAHTYMLCARSLAVWREKSAARHAERRTAQHRALQMAWQSWDAFKVHRLQHIAWTLWVQAWMKHSATRIDTRRTLARTWHVWRAHVARLSTLDQRRALFTSYVTQRLASRAWLAWRLRLGEERRTLHDKRVAETMHARACIERAWHKWRDRTDRAVELESRGDALAACVGAKQCRACLLVWRERSQLVRIDAVRCAHAVRAAWNVWWLRYARRTLLRDAAVDHVERVKDAKVLRFAMDRWKARSAALQRRTTTAAGTSDWRCLYAAWSAWQKDLTAKRSAYAAAAAHSQKHTLQQAFDAWLAALAHRRDAFAARHYHHALCLRTWTQWRFAFLLRRHISASLALFAAQQNARIEKGAFSAWRARLHSHNERTWRAHMAHDQMLNRVCLTKWMDRAKEQQSRRDAAVAFHVSRHGKAHVLRCALGVWKQRHGRRVKLRSAAGAFHWAVLRRAWHRWHDAHAQLHLAQEERRVLLLRRLALLRQCWKRWKNCSASVPLVRARRTQRQRVLFRRWADAARTAHAKRAAHAFALDTVGRDAFDSWRARVMHARDIRWISYVCSTNAAA